MILPMTRVELLGPRELLAPALEFLQREGVLELRAPAPPGDAHVRAASAGEAGRALEARLAATLDRIAALAPRLPPARGAAAPEPLPAVDSAELVPRLVAVDAELGALEGRRAALVEERDAAERFSALVEALAPLHHGLDAACDPEIHGLVLREDPAALALLEGEVRRLTGGTCDLQWKPLGDGRVGVLIAVPRVHGRALTALLFERGVDEVRLPASYPGGSLAEVLLRVAGRLRALPDEIAAADAALAARSTTLAPALQAAESEARGAIERLRAEGRCGETRFAFVVVGYMPAERVERLRARAAQAFGDRVAVLARPPRREEWPVVPVVLRNRRAIRPFQTLLALVPLPRYGSTDPSPWLALFFPLFFGLVLGDLAFGAVGVAVSLFARLRGWGGAPGRDLAAVALACAVSAAIFGLAFGEALGELGAHAGLRPLLLDRRHAFMGFLGLVIGLGAIHVGIGMALGLAGAVRGGHRREAVGRGAKLLLLGAGAVAAVAAAGVAPRGLLRPALLAGAAFLAVAVLAEGPLALLELVLGVGNVLSYSRLMALGLASVMLAEVANGVATRLDPPAAGIAVAVLLHAVNFTLGLVSPAIAALRLHYVEFFEKFYDEGGAPYRPFALGG